MTESVVNFFGTRDWDWKVISALTLCVPFLLTYFITLWNSTAAIRYKNATLKRPPTYPYVIPWLGHLISYGLDADSFLKAAKSKFGTTPFKINMPGLVQWHTSGAKHVSSMFKDRALGGTWGTTEALESMFGSPSRSVDFYRADDSGYAPTPRAGSVVLSENRIIYDIHKLVNVNLTGDSLIGITARFQEFLARQFTETEEVPKEEGKCGGWVEIDDLYAFMKRHVMKAAMESMFGPYLLSLNPTFMDDFWLFNKDAGPFFFGIPKWLMPAAFRRRTRLLEGIKKWHRFAHQHSDVSKTGPEDGDWEPYWGSKFSRKRQVMLERWEQLDETARAADDLSFIWGANANTVPAATWFLLELLFSPTLQSRLHAEFSTSLINPPPTSSRLTVPTFDVKKLCSGPLCQSIWAETLRLRISLILVRHATRDADFCGWDVRKGEMITACSRTEAMDEDVWNTKGGRYPVETFWADRFLVYPGDPTSGPLNPSARRSDASPLPSKAFPSSSYADEKNRADAKKEKVEGEGEGPKFSMDGLSASWVPFSGAPRLCPGRHFAKQEMISAAAITLAAFEMELLTPKGWKPECDMEYFGFGTMPPNGKIPVRIRRRRRA